MFNSKKQQLFGSNPSTSATQSKFVQAGLQHSAKTLSGNGALKYSTTGNDFVDQFGKMGSYKEPRSFDEISKDMSILWSQNPYLTMCFLFFIRIITRIVTLFDGTKTSSVQRGSGLKHEGIMRMMWVHIFDPEIFWQNIQLYISIASWKDIIQMLSYDLQYNGWDKRVLDWNQFGKLILVGLENPNSRNLLIKYLPQIKSNSQCKTLEAQADNIIAKWICSLLFGSKENNPSNYKKYRKLKTSGTAHQWQQLISQGKHNLVDFNTIPGRALALMVSSKYLENQNLEKKYDEWISTKPIAKYTGYPHELFKSIPTKKYQINTLNAQFNGLVETAKKGIKTNTSLIVVRDTSGSMGSCATGTTQSCFDIAKALALFFSKMLPDGYFANSFIEFNYSAKMHIWKGSTPYENWVNDKCCCVGSTNFQSVIQLLCKIKSQGVSETEFPTGILCISDGEFNPASLNKTNIQTALESLANAGFSENYINNFQIILWNLQSNAYGRNTGKKFETYGDVKNVFYFSGYDPSIISFLTGVEQKESKTPSTAEELFQAAMNQEIMQMIQI